MILLADGFSVEVGTLRSLSGELTALGERVGAAREGMAGLGDRETGHGGLAAAVHHFGHTWEYSLTAISRTAARTAQQVTLAADGYEQVDGAVANAAAGRS